MPETGSLVQTTAEAVGNVVMNSYSYVFFLLIGIVLTVVHFLTTSSSANETETYISNGIIDRINRNENGRKWFYVTIETAEGTKSAKTGNYITVPEGTDVGDEVSVRWYTTKNGNVRCKIVDEGFESLAGKDEKEKPYLLYAAIFSFAVFVILVLKSIIF